MAGSPQAVPIFCQFFEQHLFKDIVCNVQFRNLLSDLLGAKFIFLNLVSGTYVDTT
jgi:hypothetical protein